MSTGKMSDEQIENRFERIGKRLRDKLSDIDWQIREARDTASYLEKLQRDINASVDKGHWWKLSNVITASDIEFLSEVEPHPRSRLLDDT